MGNASIKQEAGWAWYQEGRWHESPPHAQTLIPESGIIAEKQHHRCTCPPHCATYRTPHTLHTDKKKTEKLTVHLMALIPSALRCAERARRSSERRRGRRRRRSTHRCCLKPQGVFRATTLAFCRHSIFGRRVSHPGDNPGANRWFA